MFIYVVPLLFTNYFPFIKQMVEKALIFRDMNGKNK